MFSNLVICMKFITTSFSQLVNRFSSRSSSKNNPQLAYSSVNPVDVHLVRVHIRIFSLLSSVYSFHQIVRFVYNLELVVVVLFPHPFKIVLTFVHHLSISFELFDIVEQHCNV